MFSFNEISITFVQIPHIVWYDNPLLLSNYYLRLLFANQFCNLIYLRNKLFHLDEFFFPVKNIIYYYDDKNIFFEYPLLKL